MVLSVLSANEQCFPQSAAHCTFIIDSVGSWLRIGVVILVFQLSCFSGPQSDRHCLRHARPAAALGSLQPWWEASPPQDPSSIGILVVVGCILISVKCPPWVVWHLLGRLPGWVV